MAKTRNKLPSDPAGPGGQSGVFFGPGPPIQTTKERWQRDVQRASSLHATQHSPDAAAGVATKGGRSVLAAQRRFCLTAQLAFDTLLRGSFRGRDEIVVQFCSQRLRRLEQLATAGDFRPDLNAVKDDEDHVGQRSTVETCEVRHHIEPPPRSPRRTEAPSHPPRSVTPHNPTADAQAGNSATTRRASDLREEVVKVAAQNTEKVRERGCHLLALKDVEAHQAKREHPVPSDPGNQPRDGRGGGAGDR